MGILSTNTFIFDNEEDVEFVCLVVFNATFNNISVVSWRSIFFGVEGTRVPVENHRFAASH